MNQQPPVNEQLKALEAIQEIDLKIDQVRARKDELPKQLASLESDLASAQKEFKKQEERKEELAKAQKQAQAAIELNQDRMERASSKLEGVQNSQEYAAATKEIEQLKKMNTNLEEQLETGKKDVEAVDGDIATANDKVQEVRKARDEAQEEISGKSAELDTEINKLEGEKKEFLDKVGKPALSLYNRIRRKRGGLAVAHAVDGRCKACNMMLPPQIFNEIQKFEKVFQCLTCHRIMVIPDENSSDIHSAEAGA